MKLFLSRNKHLVLVVILGVVFSSTNLFAAPPSSGGYTPGQILDPECSPGESVSNGDLYDCFVNNTQAITIGDDIVNATANALLFSGGSSTLSNNASLTWNGTVINTPGLTINSAYTFPTSDGTSGYALTTNGTGTVSWANIATNPAGTNTQIQFNNSGSFGAAAGLTWNGTVLGATGLTINSAYTFPTSDGTSGQVLQTDGSGNVSWSADDGTEKTTNYHLSRERNITHLEDGSEVVNITDWNDDNFGGSHALVYVAEHDYLFSAVRSSDNPKFTRFDDPDDLTSSTTVDVTGAAGYGYSDQIVYSPTKDKLYMILNDFGYTQQNMKVIEIDPVTLSYSLVIDENLGAGNRAGAGLLTELDGYLYVVEGYYTSIINKYDLSDYSLTDSYTVTDANNAVHSLETDGQYLYFATTWNSSNHTVGVINPTDMTLVDSQTFNFGTAAEASSGVTDDIVVWGDYLFMPLEGYTTNTVAKIKKTDLTDVTYLDFGMTNTRGYYAIISDGEYIWFGGTGDIFGRFDPVTNTGELFDVTSLPGSNVNEIATDGHRLFLAGYDDPYPAGDGGNSYIARYSYLPGVVETFVIDANGSRMAVYDKANSRFGINTADPAYSLDVTVDATGTVARFTSDDGNCTVDPAVVGGVSCSSDETLKKDITPISFSFLDKLINISPVEYRWKKSSRKQEKTIGFIAQDVRKVLPELVTEDPDTKKLTLSYSGLVVPLVGSVRELGLRLSSLEAVSDLNMSGNTNKMTSLFSEFLSTTQKIIINGLVIIKNAVIDNLVTKRVETETLCIEEVCLTKESLQQLLNINNISSEEQISNNESLEEDLELISNESEEEEVKVEESLDGKVVDEPVQEQLEEVPEENADFEEVEDVVNESEVEETLEEESAQLQEEVLEEETENLTEEVEVTPEIEQTGEI